MDLSYRQFIASTICRFGNFFFYNLSVLPTILFSTYNTYVCRYTTLHSTYNLEFYIETYMIIHVLKIQHK
jgi:hypothetical protein